MSFSPCFLLAEQLLGVGCQDLPASPAEHDPHLVPQSHTLDHLHFTDVHMSLYT